MRSISDWWMWATWNGASEPNFCHGGADDAPHSGGRRARQGFAQTRRPAVHVNFEETAVLVPEPEQSMIAVDEALTAFSEIAARQAKVVELRYFGGLTEEEIAQRAGYLAAHRAARLGVRESLAGAGAGPFLGTARMTPERLRQIEELFHAARERSAEERASAAGPSRTPNCAAKSNRCSPGSLTISFWIGPPFERQTQLLEDRDPRRRSPGPAWGPTASKASSAKAAWARSFARWTPGWAAPSPSRSLTSGSARVSIARRARSPR